MSKTGRPTVLHEMRRREVCALLCAGCSLRAAARYIGCAPSTISRTSQVDARFARDVRYAYMRRELTLLHNIRHAGTTSWRASAWLLERLYPERYGRRARGTGVSPVPRPTGILPVESGADSPTVGRDQRSAGPPSADPPPRNSLESILNVVPVEYRDLLAQRLQEANYERGIDDFVADDHEDIQLAMGGEPVDDRSLAEDPGAAVLSSSSSSSTSPCQAGKPDLPSSTSPSQAGKPDLPSQAARPPNAPTDANGPLDPIPKPNPSAIPSALVGLLLIVAILHFVYLSAAQPAVASTSRVGQAFRPDGIPDPVDHHDDSRSRLPGGTSSGAAHQTIDDEDEKKGTGKMPLPRPTFRTKTRYVPPSVFEKSTILPRDARIGGCLDSGGTTGRRLPGDG